MKFLCLHGVGHGDANTQWRKQWEDAVRAGLRPWNDALAPKFDFPEYDDLFDKAPLHTGTVLESLTRLTASGLFHGFIDIFRSRGGLEDTLDSVRWTAGMVAQWVADEGLRAKTRALVANRIRIFQPDVILAHSLGSLILYDTLRSDEVARGGLARGRTVVTFGSQVGNPAVRSVFAGRVEELESASWWWHLYNEYDDVFTCPIQPSTGKHFDQVQTPFDIEGFADHDGAHYLGHEQTGLTVWRSLASGSRSLHGEKRSVHAAARGRAAVPSGEKTQYRALLVGIAEYPDPDDCLGGPVNDVFLMSSVLQELDFPPESIRVVLNERATAAGIRERLGWLLDDAKPDDRLFFYFAGHGTQVPTSGREAEADRIDECLVPYDFDWKDQKAITDDEFAAAYSRLPYETQFVAVLDCCHAGGMVRASGSGVRGLTPPDDIRHRAIRWDKDSQMWLPREKFESAPKRGSSTMDSADLQKKELWVGQSGSVRKLGRASGLWMKDSRKFDATRKQYGHKGPYTPILLEACRENEKAYEYRHGAVRHGAFTFSLCKILREAARPATRRELTFPQLRDQVEKEIATVVAEPQTPQLLIAKERRHRTIPGLAKARRRGAGK